MMTKKKIEYIQTPKTAFLVTDEVLAKSLHRMKQQDQDVVVVTETKDAGLLISRIARLLKPGFQVFVKTDDDDLWLQHFCFVGEAKYGFKVFACRP
jgi:hypothetical protein